MNNDFFSNYHPIVNFIFFGVVITFTMFNIHPLFLMISCISSFLYSIYLNGRKGLKFNIIYMLPFLIVTALINPTFNHEGSTILMYLSNGNPITLESIAFGIASAIMFISVIYWFSCYNVVMTSDKHIYLFGKILPALSLIFSMVMRFVPMYKAQIKAISNAQKCIGRDVTDGNIINRIKNGVKILSIMVTWALENGIDTADSMKARGFGLKGRTSFSIYKFGIRDRSMILFQLVCIVILIIGAHNGISYIRYFPSIKYEAVHIGNTYMYISYALFCISPLLLNVVEDIKWIYLKSSH